VLAIRFPGEADLKLRGVAADVAGAIRVGGATQPDVAINDLALNSDSGRARGFTATDVSNSRWKRATQGVNLVHIMLTTGCP
jgi:hypothetical protein